MAGLLWMRVRAVTAAAGADRVTVAPSPNVVLAMRDLSRLETSSYHMERVIELTDDQTHLFGLVKSRDALLLVAVGDVTAGVDLGKLGDGDVETDWAKRKVRVRLPAPEIFSTALDNARTHVVTRSTDILAQRHEDLEGKARAEAESSMKGGAVDAGILDRAQAGAEREVRSLLKSLGFEQVDVDFKK